MSTASTLIPGLANTTATSSRSDSGSHSDSEDADLARTVRLLGLDFHAFGLERALAILAGREPDGGFAYVVTPNADHLVRLARDPATYGPLYRDAWLRLLDSRVVAKLSRLVGLAPPPVVPGSDLTEALFQRLLRKDEPVTILGLAPPLVSTLSERLGLRRVVHHYPPLGFDRDPRAFEAALAFLEANPARFMFLAVGSPRQEQVARCLAERGRATGTALCIGASLLFLAGGERRAPVPLRRAGLEWAWRLGQDPRGKARRYLVDSPAVIRLLIQERKARLGSGSSGRAAA